MSKEKLNPCKCGSTKKPILDSDDMVSCWTVVCNDCKQFQHGLHWTINGAINKWNIENSLEIVRDYKINQVLTQQ